MIFSRSQTSSIAFLAPFPEIILNFLHFMLSLYCFFNSYAMDVRKLYEFQYIYLFSFTLFLLNQHHICFFILIKNTFIKCGSFHCTVIPGLTFKVYLQILILKSAAMTGINLIFLPAAGHHLTDSAALTPLNTPDGCSGKYILPHHKKLS